VIAGIALVRLWPSLQYLLNGLLTILTSLLAVVLPVLKENDSVIEACSIAISTLMTVLIINYARVTVEEGRKDRRKDLLDKALEEVYSPLFDIFSQELMREDLFTKKQGEWQVDSKVYWEKSFTYHLTDEQLKCIRRIVERFGHLIPPQLRMDLANAIYLSKRENSNWLFTDEKNGIFGNVKVKSRKILQGQLIKLRCTPIQKYSRNRV
jgi:hypothetical protein